jgi:hypothetical protein
MHTITTIANAYVEGCENWLFPANVSLRAIPNALTAMTDTDPTVEQIDM